MCCDQERMCETIKPKYFICCTSSRGWLFRVSVEGKMLLLFVSNIHLHFEVLNVIRLS